MEYDSPVWLQAMYWIVLVIGLVSTWKIFLKANKPGWASIIPIYNSIVYIQIAGRPVWWVILLFIPIVNFVIGIIVLYDLLRAFGKGLGFFFGMIFLPFIFQPILAFGSSTYQGTKSASGENTDGQVPPNMPPPQPSMPPATPPTDTPPQAPDNHQ